MPGAQGNNEVPGPGVDLSIPHPLRFLFFSKNLGDSREDPLFQGVRNKLFRLDISDATMPSCMELLQAGIWEGHVPTELADPQLEEGSADFCSSN